MSDEIDDFLKQAAKRRQQRQQQRANQSSRQQPNPPPAAPPTQNYSGSQGTPSGQRLQPTFTTPPPIDAIPTAEVVEPERTLVTSVKELKTTISAGDSIRPTIVDSVAREIATPKGKNKNQPKQRPSVTTDSSVAKKVSVSSHSSISSSRLIQQLRDPETLRMAIIAHELMKRPWS